MPKSTTTKDTRKASKPLLNQPHYVMSFQCSATVQDEVRRYEVGHPTRQPSLTRRYHRRSGRRACEGRTESEDAVRSSRPYFLDPWLPFQTRDTGGKPLRHEQLPHSAVEVDGSQGAAQEPLVRKEVTQRSKSVPVGTKKRGRGRSRVHGWGMGRFSMVDLGEFNVADEWGASDRMSA